jgi:hypothetical protein
MKSWRRGVPSSLTGDPEVHVEAELEITRTHGWTFFNLVVANHSRMRVAVVDATLSINGLVAKFQACPATKQSTLKIRHVAKPGEVFTVSLIELFYNGAGKPQGAYSFIAAPTLRFRAHGDLFERALPVYRVKMFALSPNSLQRIPQSVKLTESTEPSSPLPELESADLQWLDTETRVAPSL